MFEKETLLILGAGASKPYGFPLGGQLVKDIVTAIRKDSVFFPYLREKKNLSKVNLSPSLSDYNVFVEEEEQQNFLHKIRSHAKNARLKKLIEVNSRLPFTGENIVEIQTYKICYSTELARIKLNAIKELHDLANMLEEIDPISIDAFLRDHQEYRIAGHAMIIYCLIKCHDKKKFIADFKSIDEKRDNWYRYLLNSIKAGCKNPKNILENKLSITTFNYDVSLDFYLKSRLEKTSYFLNFSSEYLEKTKIDHIYGSICEPNIADDFYDLNSKDALENDILNFHHLLYGVLESSKKHPRIKLIGERQPCSESLKKIKKANIIIFIGFSFDTDNLTTLGFPQTKNAYTRLLAPKTTDGKFIPKKIFYLDYEGKMNSLSSEFDELKKFFVPSMSIQRSIATSISDAYVNDFRTSLFS